MASYDFATVVEALADGLPDVPCFYFGEKVLTWSQYDDRAARIAASLADAGLVKDSKVGLFLYNGCEYMEATAAAFKNRCIPININYRYVGNELVYLLNDCEAEALIFHSSLAPQVDEIRAQLPKLKLLICVDDDGAEVFDSALNYADLITNNPPMPRIERSGSDSLMLYTGGTTGMPKGVIYEQHGMLSSMLDVGSMFFGLTTPENLEQVVASARARHDKGQSFVSLPASPLMHTAGILNSGILMQMLGGAMAILTSRSFNPRELWQLIERHKVNHMVVVGDTFVKPMLKVIDEDQAKGVEYDLSSLKAIVSSGVIFSQESKLKLLALADVMILDIAGATEGGMAVQTSTRAMPPSATASFMAMAETEIFDEEYNLLPRGNGEVGFIGMGGTLPQGYYKDAAKTAKTFRNINGVRYGFTGDMGAIEPDGTLLFKGRGSGCINTGGEKVFPEEVEEVIKLHPAVNDCLVVGLPDDRFGEKVAAVVSLHGAVDDIDGALLAFGSDHLARYKLPRVVHVVSKVERAPNGKADYKWAKQVLSQA